MSIGRRIQFSNAFELSEIKILIRLLDDSGELPEIADDLREVADTKIRTEASLENERVK